MSAPTFTFDSSVPIDTKASSFNKKPCKKIEQSRCALAQNYILTCFGIVENGVALIASPI